MKNMKKRRLLILLVTCGIIILICAEVFLRVKGLGNPPIMILDDKIEYYHKPGAYQQFGETIDINSNNLRSADLTPKHGQKRIALLGDSIVHGTFRLNNEQLVASVMKKHLRGRFGADLEVINIAAVSWGPVNQAAFIERFGLFEADRVVWIISSHDLWDVPVDGYAELLPTKQPLLAMQDAMWIVWRKFIETRLDVPSPKQRANQTLKAMEKVLNIIEHQKLPLRVAYHLDKYELDNGIDPTAAPLRELLKQRGIDVMLLTDPLKKAESLGGAYADDIHLSAKGANQVGTWLAKQLIQTEGSP